MYLIIVIVLILYNFYIDSKIVLEEFMGLRELIDEKYRISIKSKNFDLINTLRLVRSSIKDKDIENRSSNSSELINDQSILILLQNLIKQRKDSIESFKKANRSDLIEKEEKEIEIINQFLPKQLDNEEINNIIKEIIKKENLSSIKDMGKLMSLLKSEYSGSIDIGVASKIAKELLLKK